MLATKDRDARVRTRAVKSLASTRDAYFAGTYQHMLNDPSYATIRAAAEALGQTKSTQAYESLVKLIDIPSWRDTIRASALTGLAALGDTRGLEFGIKYQAAPNSIAVRNAAMLLIAAAAKDDPRAFSVLSGALIEGFDRHNFELMNGAAEALIALGDRRAIAAFQDLRKKAADFPQILNMISGFEARLRGRIAPAKPNR